MNRDSAPAYGLWSLVIINSLVFITGFLFQWPTLVTLAMFPVRVFMYVHLAWREERDAVAGFGDAYSRYMVRTPAFVPRIGRSPSAAQ
jgi:protein-S-isoprenylcysteine O-methyltransferase Ste14